MQQIVDCLVQKHTKMQKQCVVIKGLCSFSVDCHKE